MKYRVTITQSLKYDNRIIGTFDNLEVAQTFIEMTMEHFGSTAITIEAITEGSEAAE